MSVAEILSHFREMPASIPIGMNPEEIHRNVAAFSGAGRKADIGRDWQYGIDWFEENAATKDDVVVVRYRTDRGNKSGVEMPAFANGDTLKIFASVAINIRDSKNRLYSPDVSTRYSWMLNKARSIGLVVEDLKLAATVHHKISAGDKDRKEFIVYESRFAIVGKVKDEVAFASAVASGIGKRKAYGLGLIRYFPI